MRNVFEYQKLAVLWLIAALLAHNGGYVFTAWIFDLNAAANTLFGISRVVRSFYEK
jgi:hypothetical protein